MARTALLVGVDTYAGSAALRSCAADASAMEQKLSRHKDGRKNFHCTVWPDRTPEGEAITRPRFRAELQKAFNRNDDVTLLYFAGHGFLSKSGGVLCTSDSTKDDWGIAMQEVVDLAALSPSRQILIILDCCHSGAMANPGVMNSDSARSPLAAIRENMTVISASRGPEETVEGSTHGVFTTALLDALEGGAADHIGFVTAPALYAYVSSRFAASDHRPVYKTNATEVLIVRECEPLIERLELKQLTNYFPAADFKYRLDSEYEPEDEEGNVREPVNQQKVEIAHLFKAYRDAGLLKSSDPMLQLYWVARKGGTVELTPRGKEYWWLIYNNKV